MVGKYRFFVLRSCTIFLLWCMQGHSYAAEYSLVTQANIRAEYNDNIFITSAPHDSVTGLVVSPQARLVAKEQNWQSYLNTKLVVNRYSDDALDSNDLLFDWKNNYTFERHVVSLDVKYNKDSTLNSTSSDFGIVARRVRSRSKSFAPSYQYMLNERARLTVSAARTRVDYSDEIGFIGYSLNSVSGSWLQAVSESDTFSLTLQGTRYESDRGLYKYDLNVIQLGLQHQFSKLWSFNGAIGNSRRSASNQTTSTINFFGQTVSVVQVNNSTTTGLILDAVLTRELEKGDIAVTLSRNNTTNAFGGLNEISTFKVASQYQLTELWRQVMSLRYEDVNAVSAGSRVTDRTVLLFEFRMIRQIDRRWKINASYRYAARQFDAVSAGDAFSNRIYLGMTYNFPDISTF